MQLIKNFLVLFLRARILKLIQMGALDDIMETLLLNAKSNNDPKLTDLWSKVSFLTLDLINFVIQF